MSRQIDPLLLRTRHDGRVLTVSVRRAPYAAARSLLVTAEIMLGVTLAHTLAGGRLPSPVWVIGLASVVYAATWRLDRGSGASGRQASRASVLRSLSVVTATQLVLHAALAGMAPTEHAHGAGGWAALGLTWQMVAAHVASALLTLLVWRARRRALHVVLDWTDVRTAVLTPARPAPAGAIESMESPRYWTTRAPRRGPPGLALQPA